MAGEFLTIEQTIRELQVDVAELNRLVSQGELRAFREGNAMKFKREDVINLRKGRESEPTIILTDSDQALGVPTGGEELIIEEEPPAEETVIQLEPVADEEIGATQPTMSADDDDALLVEIAPNDTEEEIPIVELENGSSTDLGVTEEISEPVDATEPDGEPTVVDAVEEGSETIVEATELATEPLELVDAEVEEEEPLVRTSASRRGAVSGRLREIQMKQKGGHLVWTVLLLVTSGSLLVPVGVYVNVFRGTQPEWLGNLAASLGGIAISLYTIFL